ncbi:MAG: hypothetical protein LW731_01555 [Oxalobacteraceae bacterium]|jgi:hypothetical protein|nr:hypothetical protein [Oxalobacteraceae bacterium]
MIIKIELGSFSRNENSPIMLKEKVESDGSSSLRIYQRKDIDSINSFKDKIKTMMKYGIEDFCMAHETFRPLLQSVGVKGINRLTTNDPKSTQDLLQSIRSEARTGAVTGENESKLKQILADYALPEDYEINFYKGKYKTEDLFSDLKQFISSDDSFSKKYKFKLGSIERAFTSKEILKKEHADKYEEVIKHIKDSLNNHFKKQEELLAAQPGKSTHSSENNCSVSSLSRLKELQKEIVEKLDEIENEIKQRSITPKDEDIKNQLISTIEYVLGAEKNSEEWTDEFTKKDAEIRATIDILFSTSWWISEERKMESLKKVQDFFEGDKFLMPEAVINRIYPNQKSTNLLSTSNPQRLTNPYIDIGNDRQ